MENWKLEMGGKVEGTASSSGEGRSLKPYQTVTSSPEFNGPRNDDHAGCNDQHQPNYNISMCSLASLILLHNSPPSPAGSAAAGDPGEADRDALKAKIISHPNFSNLLHYFLECLKVGASPEVGTRLAKKCYEFEAKQIISLRDPNELDQFMDETKVEDRDLEVKACLGATLHEFEVGEGSSGDPNDPQLDEFMEAYCAVLSKYKEEIEMPVKKAINLMQKIESKLNILTINNGLSRHVLPFDEHLENMGTSTYKAQDMNQLCEHEELKNYLLRKYGSSLSNLKQEVSKKREVKKLPRKARLKLLKWWELHRKWPYPSDSEKVALQEATGLDDKQINNWFINQRKRHWKGPDEALQAMVMECIQ